MDTRIESGFSNFLYVDRKFRAHPVLRRLFSLARKFDYKSLLVETIAEDDCALLTVENAALRLRKPDFISAEVYRLSFWKSPPDTAPEPSDFIGYAIFKEDRFASLPRPECHVFESVFPTVRGREENNFVHCQRSYAVNTAAGSFSVRGTLYAQQNDCTFVCAHVALRSSLACMLPEGDITYAEINALAGVDHQTRMVGENRGLGPDDMEAIITGKGFAFEKVAHEPRKQIVLPTEFQRDLYGLIESGFPALVGFELDDPNPGPNGSARHIIPVIGHTFNEDAWVPDAQRNYFGNQLRYFSSESWLSSFMVHDDNFGPYYCLPRHFLKQDNFRLILGIKDRATAFAAVDAEATGFNFVSAIARTITSIGQDWFDRFSIYARKNMLVMRTQLVRREHYAEHLASIRDWESNALETSIHANILARLPDRFWLVEASAPELFGTSRRKFGELIIDADAPLPTPLTFAPLHLARLPGLIVIPNQGSLETSDTDLRGHTPLFAMPFPETTK